MINRYQHESVNLVEWPLKQRAVAHTPEAAGLALSSIPPFKVGLLGSKNIFPPKTAHENGFVPLTALELQILAEGIILDDELIAECRSGEI